MNKIFSIIIMLMAFLLPSLSWADEDEEEKIVKEKLILRFGTYAWDRPNQVIKKLRPIMNILEQKLAYRLDREVEIRMHVVYDFEDAIQNLVKARVDFSQMGQVHYVEAKRIRPSIKILALESVQKSNKTNGVIFVHRDSSLQSLQDLKGHSVAFGPKNSAIGHYLPQQFLMEKRIRAKDLKKHRHFKRDQLVAKSVANKKYDAGVISQFVFDRLVQESYPIRTLSTFKVVTNPWVTREGMLLPVKVALKKALLSMDYLGIFKPLGLDGFVRGRDRHFHAVRRAQLANWLFETKVRSQR